MKLLKKIGYILTSGALIVGLSVLALENFTVSYILFSIYTAGYSALLYLEGN